jgi:hypothetical protein
VTVLETGRVALRIGDKDKISSQTARQTVPVLRLEGAPAVPLISRDSFVAETANKIEQMQASLRLLTREVGELSKAVGDMKSAADQDHRWHAYQENDRKARSAKFEEVLRVCRDLKSRLDRIEPRAGGNYHAYNSFESVSRKLAELESFRDEARRVERNVTRRAWLFSGALVLASVIIVASNILPA